MVIPATIPVVLGSISADVCMNKDGESNSRDKSLFFSMSDLLSRTRPRARLLITHAFVVVISDRSMSVSPLKVLQVTLLWTHLRSSLNSDIYIHCSTFTMTDVFATLYCIVKYDSTSKSFSVEIQCSKTVGNLKTLSMQAKS